MSGIFGFFKRCIGRGGPKPSLDAVRFDTTGYQFHSEPCPGKLRGWYTPEGDVLEVHFILLAPDLPANATSVDEFAAAYCQLPRDSGCKLVEVGVITVGDRPAVRTIVSFLQEPSGRIYVGSLTVPFRDFSFVLKCQCAEVGITGIREAFLFASVPKQFEGDQICMPVGWDPDAEQYDAKFPAHPISRVRRVLRHVAGSLVIDAEVRQMPGFPLPQQSD